MVFVLLLLIGAVALIELFMDAGGRFAPPTAGIDRPGIKPVQKHIIVNEFAQSNLKINEWCIDWMGVCLPADVDSASDGADGKVFDCDNDGNDGTPIIMLFATDAGILVIPFRLFSVESMPKPLFPLLWCGLPKPVKRTFRKSTNVTNAHRMAIIPTYTLVVLVKPMIVQRDHRNWASYSASICHSLLPTVDLLMAYLDFYCLKKCHGTSRYCNEHREMDLVFLRQDLYLVDRRDCDLDS